jgi:RHS repeat-associated protein
LSFVLLSSVIHVGPAAAAPTAPTPIKRELADQRTAYSRTWDNGDGTRTYESFFDPINYRDIASGAWLPIDTSLDATVTPKGRALKNRANGFTLVLPDDIGADDVMIGAEETSIRIRPQGRLAEPEVFDAYETTASAVPMDTRARKYSKAFASTDLLYESTSRGLKETIILNSPSKKNTFSFDMACVGLTPSLDASGAILFTRDSTSKVLFQMVPPYMVDSSVNTAGDPAYSDAVRYELERKGLGWRIDVVADQAWLADSARVYPVKIDPTTYYDWQTYNYDSYVTSQYPSTNYGYSTDLKTGRVDSSSTGINRSFVKPWLDPILGKGYSVLSAKLELYCYWKYFHTTSAKIRVATVAGSWSEGGITWNNQPSSLYVTDASVSEGARAYWDVTEPVKEMVLGESTNYGFRLYAENEGTDLTYWCKFYSLDSGDSRIPYLSIKYTTAPKATIVAPAIDTPVSSAAATIHAHWNYSDGLGKKQVKAQVQVATTATDAAPVQDVTVDTSATVMDIPAPAAGWSQTRYFIRMRVWAAGEGDAAGLVAPGAWTAWQPFERKLLTSGSDGAGLNPSHATDPVGAGLSVDLATGHLVGSRADFSGPGLGIPITYGATYDSSRTVDAGLGAGWKMAAPSLLYNDQKAPNSSFELSTNGNPTSWIEDTDPGDAAYIYTTTGVAKTGTSSARFRYIDTGYANLWLATARTAAAALQVSPGQRISASAWVYTVGLDSDTTQDEYGALMKFHFFDGTGAEMDHVKYSKVSEGYCCPDSGGWKQITLEATVPKGAYAAALQIEMRNAKGSFCVDDVMLNDKTVDFTDGDGTSRTIAPAEDGAYKRDPLEPSVAFSRVNVARDASVTAIGGTIASESVDGIINDCQGLLNYDGVDWKTNGSAHLTYTLPHAQVISGADLYLLDRPLETAVGSQPVYTYRIETSEDGKTFKQVVPAASAETSVTGRGWMKHTFAPVRAKYVRVVALGNTYDYGFRVCELELPQMRLGDAAVCFDSAGRLAAIGDLSGNPTKYTYDASGRLAGVADATRAGSTEATRGLELNWSGNRLASLDWRGVSSGGSAAFEPEIVRFASIATTSGSEYRVLRTNNGTETAVLTYLHDLTGRIVGARDAEGVGFTLVYTSGRVSSVTRSGDPTPTVTTYTYGTGQVTIASAAGGVAAPTRVVDISSALGYQMTKLKVVDPVDADPVTTIAYDEYGHQWKTTDPLGRITRTERDGHGNVVMSAACDSTGKVLQQSSAEYNDDHISKTVDSKDNVSSLRYDDAWRVLVASQAVADDTADGGNETRLTYDDWGNQATGSTGGSTAYNLLRNGTFELNPLLAGNGWDGTKAKSPSWDLASQDYTGDHYMVLGDYTGAEFITSDEIAVDPSKTYTLSAWMNNWGRIIVNEYDTDHAFLRSRSMLHSAASSSVNLLRRVSATYVPTAGTAYARVQPYTSAEGGFCVDNIRFELANAASPDCFVENESMEQVVSGLPRSWTKSSSTAIHEASSDEAVSGLYSAHIKVTTTLGYFYGPKVYVNEDERYTVSLSMKTKDSIGGAKAIVRFFDKYGATLAGKDTTITGDAVVRGTEDWCRYVKDVTVPVGAASIAVNLYHEIGGGDAYWDAVTVAPAAGISKTEYDASTHSVAVKSTGVTGVSLGSATDSRGRSIETSIKPTEETTIALSARSYDDLDRLTAVETAPGSSLGITAAFTYTAAGRLATVTGPRSATTTLSYDAAGRPTGVVSPLGVRSLLHYDALGRLLETFWPSQSQEPTAVASRVSYDSLGRAGSSDVFAEDGTLYAHIVPTYDLASRVTKTEVSGQVTGTVDVTYDDLDRATTTVAQGPAGTMTSVVGFESNSNLPVAIKTTALESSRTVTNAWAKTGQLLRTTSGTQTWNFGFGTSGGLSSAFATGLSMHTRSYDVFGRLEAVRLGRVDQTTPPFNDFAESVLTYDNQGRIAGTGLTGDATRSDTFGYDAASRLTSWARTGTGATSATYAYDPSGNLTTATVGGIATGFTYDIGDRLTRSANSSTTTTYTNDLLGRRTAAVTATGTTTYTWDPLSRLTAVSSPDATATYAYGPTGMRELKTVTTPSGTKTTKTVWSGSELVMELDSDGASYTYLWGPGRIPLSVTAKTAAGVSTTYAYQVDAMGSVIGMTDEEGTVVARYSYDPWGNPSPCTPGTDPGLTARNPLRYRAYYADIETGLYYMPARYYDPATYRFLSLDPAPPSAGDPASLNGFLYCVDDPVNLSDTDGREPHGYNMCDGYGDDGYNYGHDDYHSTVDQQGNVTPSKNSQGMAASAAASRGMAEARVEASLAMKAAQAEAAIAACNGTAPSQTGSSDELAKNMASAICIGAGVAGVALGVFCVGLAIAGTGGLALLAPFIVGAAFNAIAVFGSEASYKKGWISRGERDLSRGLGVTGFAVSAVGFVPMAPGVSTAVAMQGVCLGVTGTALSVAGSAPR